MAAPHVSLEYWKKTISKYSEYSKKQDNSEKNFSALLSGNMHPALDIFIESNDYEDAKLIWLTRGANKKQENTNLTNSNENNNGTEYYETLENRLKYLSQEDNLNTITYFISKKYLLNGDPLMAAANFLSVKDTFNTMKTLVRSNEYELAFMFMKIINDKFYEEDIYFNLCMKEYKKGNM